MYRGLVAVSTSRDEGDVGGNDLTWNQLKRRNHQTVHHMAVNSDGAASIAVAARLQELLNQGS